MLNWKLVQLESKLGHFKNEEGINIQPSMKYIQPSCNRRLKRIK